MGLKDFFRAICCCGAYNKTKEKEPLLRNNHSGTTYSAESVALSDDEWNLWGTPHDSSHIESDDDRELYSLIVTRNQLQHNTEEWEKLNYDIHTLRQTHREVRGRWRKILEKLGFQKEVDSLLLVSKSSTLSDPENLSEVNEVLLKLSEETSLFPNGFGVQERYLFVLIFVRKLQPNRREFALKKINIKTSLCSISRRHSDRLVSLDAAEEFFKMAKKNIPRTLNKMCNCAAHRANRHLLDITLNMERLSKGSFYSCQQISQLEFQEVTEHYTTITVSNPLCKLHSAFQSNLWKITDKMAEYMLHI